MKREVRNLRVKCEHDFIRFHRYFPQCRVPTIDIGLFRGGQSPFYEKSSCTLFGFLGKFKKGAEYFYRVFRKLSYMNQPGFFEVQKPRESRLFYFQIGRCLAAPFPQPFSFLGRTAFSFSMNNIPCLKKGTGGNGGKS